MRLTGLILLLALSYLFNPIVLAVDRLPDHQPPELLDSEALDDIPLDASLIRSEFDDGIV